MDFVEFSYVIIIIASEQLCYLSITNQTFIVNVLYFCIKFFRQIMQHKSLRCVNIIDAYTHVYIYCKYIANQNADRFIFVGWYAPVYI